MAGNDPALLADMLTKEQLGRRVSVSEKDGQRLHANLILRSRVKRSVSKDGPERVLVHPSRRGPAGRS